MTGSQLVKRFQLRTMRSVVRRACSTSRAGVVKIRKRSRLGRAFRNADSRARRFNPVSRLCVMTATRNHAASAPKRLEGSTPAPNSCFKNLVHGFDAARLFAMPFQQAFGIPVP